MCTQCETEKETYAAEHPQPGQGLEARSVFLKAALQTA